MTRATYLFSFLVIISVFFLISSIVARRFLVKVSVDPEVLTFGRKFYVYDNAYRVKRSDGVTQEVNESEIGNYGGGEYEITLLPEQTSLEYSAGYFVSLEDINGSEDKYLVLNDEEGKNNKYRVIFDWDVNTSSVPWAQTVLVVESVGFYGLNKRDILPQKVVPIKLSFEELNLVLKPKDVVVVMPRIDGQYRNGTDENGHIVSEMLTVVRMFGSFGVKTRLNISSFLSYD